LHVVPPRCRLAWPDDDWQAELLFILLAVDEIVQQALPLLPARRL
jgi:hypothetical protein